MCSCVCWPIIFSGTMKQRLAPWFAQDGTQKNRRWSFANVLERLKAIRQERAKLNGIEFDQVPCRRKTNKASSNGSSEAVAIGVKSKDGVISHAVNGLVRPVQQQYTTRMSRAAPKCWLPASAGIT